MQRLVEVSRKWPEPLPPMRRVELKERIARARAEREASKHAVAEKVGIPEVQRHRTAPFVTPALDLTPEEIQARRDKELEEIRVYRNT